MCPIYTRRSLECATQLLDSMESPDSQTSPMNHRWGSIYVWGSDWEVVRFLMVCTTTLPSIHINHLQISRTLPPPPPRLSSWSWHQCSINKHSTCCTQNSVFFTEISYDVDFWALIFVGCDPFISLIIVGSHLWSCSEHPTYSWTNTLSGL